MTISGKPTSATARAERGQTVISDPRDGELALVLRRSASARRFRVDLYDGPDACTGKFFVESEGAAPLPDLQKLTETASPRWPELVVTQGELSQDTAAAYVVDTIKLPDANPWGAPMFTTAFDFF